MDLYEQDYQYGMETIVAFETKVTITEIRKAITDNVRLIDTTGAGMHLINDSDTNYTWAFGGLPGFGDGLAVNLYYNNKGNGIFAVFEVGAIYSSAGIAPFIDLIRELRSQVIEAFKTIDPDVIIYTDIDEIDKIADSL